MKITKEQINNAAKTASSYKEFKKNLEEFGCKVPPNVKKFPMSMTGWGRKLQYEFSKSDMYSGPFTNHDRRKTEFYNRLERLGCPEPLFHMHK